MAGITLNPSQKQAVEHRKGPLLIIAGAGTGKTRVITQRIAWLIEQKLAEPNEILALTFTQKAAQEMEERVDIEMPYGFFDMWISTFHAFCDRILRKESVFMGLDPAFTLMTQAQEYVFFRNHLFELPLEALRPKGNPTKFIGAILKHFSRLGDEYVSPEDYDEFIKSAKNLPKEKLTEYRELAKVYKKYSEIKRESSKLGFYDLVPQVLNIFREKESILEEYRERFKYILVDEFQDTNYSQNELVKLLAGKDGNITVVGDDDQAIYKFRGAAISNILDFKKTFPGCKTIVLNKNYRSCQPILDESYKLIQNNNPDRLEVTEKIDKKLDFALDDLNVSGDKSSDLPSDQISMEIGNKESRRKSEKSSSSQTVRCDPECVRRIHAQNAEAESDLVADEIIKLVKDKNVGLSFSDIAVLVRANNHADEFVKSFKIKGIPYVFPGPKGLYSKSEIKDLISILRAIIDYNDDASIYRILSFPVIDISAREFIDLQQLARKKKVSIFKLLEEFVGVKVDQDDVDQDEPEESNELSNAEVIESILNKKSKERVKKLIDLFYAAFEGVKSQQSVGVILYEFLMEIGYIDDLVSNESVKNEWKIQNVSKFFDILKAFERENEYPTVAVFMDFLEYSLEIGESPTVDPVDFMDYDAVQVYTVHGAKGLEFPVVFMVNLVNERFPTRNRGDALPIPDELIKEVLPEGDEHLQEERRLFYVGMTRSQRLLYLTSADYYGEGIRKKKQSVFLSDIGMIKDSAITGESQKVSKTKNIEYIGIPESEIPKSARKKFVDNIVRNLSYSHISSYEKCPYQFYFKYFLRIPGKDSAPKSFGMTVHNTLKEFYDILTMYKEGLRGVAEEPSKDDLLQIFNRKWKGEGYESRKQELDRKKAGEQMLSNYFDKYFSTDENPVLLEHSFRVNFDDFWLRGVIDRVDETEDGLVIIDYKTGRAPKDDRSLLKDLQIPIYVAAIEKLHKKNVVASRFLYLEESKEFDIDVDRSNIDKSLDNVRGVLNEIKDMNFKAKPSMLCRYCDYNGICNYASS